MRADKRADIEDLQIVTESGDDLLASQVTLGELEKAATRQREDEEEDEFEGEDDEEGDFEVIENPLEGETDGDDDTEPVPANERFAEGEGRMAPSGSVD